MVIEVLSKVIYNKKNEVGMAGSKRTQTRLILFVGIITSTVHAIKKAMDRICTERAVYVQNWILVIVPFIFTTV